MIDLLYNSVHYLALFTIDHSEPEILDNVCSVCTLLFYHRLSQPEQMENQIRQSGERVS